MKEMFVGRQDPLFYIGEINLMKNQRVWIVWENWAWKSTLLKTIMWKIDVLDWMLLKWKWLKISYYSQMHEELDRESTIRQNFEKFWINYPDQQLIWLLHHYLFEKEDIEKKVKYLSWWQTSKLLFAILWQIESNVLILDEPTNHLDYDSREALEKALQKYKWTILFISHDRYFVNKMADNLWLIADWELVLNYWNYEDYKYKKEKWLDFNANLFDEEAQLNLALEDKLWEKEAKRIRQKYGRGKKNRK
jgi:ATP-binding cassette subfamily F protein 3